MVVVSASRIGIARTSYVAEKDRNIQRVAGRPPLVPSNQPTPIRCETKDEGELSVPACEWTVKVIELGAAGRRPEANDAPPPMFAFVLPHSPSVAE
jgi:hypothetical protein